MDKGKVNLWKMIETNPSEGYKEYFIEEEKYLKNNLSKKDIFLDIGCGDGRTIKLIAKLCKKIFGIDYNKQAIKNSKKNLKNLKNVEIFLENARKTHFKGKYFDVVFIGLTFSNFGESKEDILIEIKRVLKDDGNFIFSVYNENSFGERKDLYNKYAPNEIEIINKEKGLVKSKTGDEISEQFSEEELKKLLGQIGFKIIEIKKGEIFYLIKAKKLK